MGKTINNFSKLPLEEKLNWLSENFNAKDISTLCSSYKHKDDAVQKLHNSFSENTLTNYFIPYGIAPNFIINGKAYAVPMVIEESSVVAAASSAAKFWAGRGGFNYKIIDTQKVGHISFRWNGPYEEIVRHQESIEHDLKKYTQPLTDNMEKRGGGVISMEFVTVPDLSGIYQLRVNFETCDSMGANFINTVLESYASCLEIYFDSQPEWNIYGQVEIILAILSNYTPECLVEAWVSCNINQLQISTSPTEDIVALAFKFKTAVDIACADVYRATTHNKGIYNGIDAVVLATGNDFRAIEAAGHAYASHTGRYRSLSSCTIVDEVFTFSLTIPLALGTVGGLTSLHPLAKQSLEILGSPDAKELMGIIACVGLAQNFAALRSLVTTGIQKGHMKMHLQNILSHFQSTEAERAAAIKFFEDKTISHSDVRTFIENLRK